VIEEGGSRGIESENNNGKEIDKEITNIYKEITKESVP